MLPHKVSPLAFQLCIGGLKIPLPRSQVILLEEVRHMTWGGTEIRWREPGGFVSVVLAVDVVEHARGCIEGYAVGVVLWALPRERLEEGTE